MNTLECIKTRRSVRKFKPDKVPHALLEQVVAAASYAPSWKNTQVTRYIAVDQEELKERLAKECCDARNQEIIMNAPMIVATTLIEARSGFERDGSYRSAKGSDWQVYDCGIAGGIFTIAAHDLGLATVIIGLYDYAKASEILAIPDGQTIMSLIAIGYADEAPAAPKKKTVADLLSYR